jgi:glycerol-3-phosphate cytidylyltransferase
VDEILVYDTEADLLNLIKTQTFHIRFLSEEYRDIEVTGKQYCIDNGIQIHYHKRRHQYSTTELRNRVYELEKAKREEKNIQDIKQYSPELLEKYSLKNL